MFCFRPRDPCHADMLDGDLTFAPARILVTYGTNDWTLKSSSEFAHEAERFVFRLRTLFPQTPIALISPIWRADADIPKDSSFPFDHVHDILRTIASSGKNIRFISGIPLMPHVKELYFDCSVHPNEIGFTRLHQKSSEFPKSFRFHMSTWFIISK